MCKAELAIKVVSELQSKPYWVKQEVQAGTRWAIKSEMREFKAAAIRNGYTVLAERITYKEV